MRNRRRSFSVLRSPPELSLRCGLVGAFLLALTLLMMLQMKNVLTWCTPPKIDREFIEDVWSLAEPGQCGGPVFSKLERGRLHVACRDSDELGMYKLSKFERYERVPSNPTPVSNEVVWTKCDEGIYGAQENVLVQNIFDETILQRQLQKQASVRAASPSSLEPITVVFLLVSSLSRDHFSRALPLTHKFLEDAQKEYLPTYEVFDFAQYNAVASEPLYNQLALMTGNVDAKGKWAWDILHDKGYVTMFGEEACAYARSIRVQFPPSPSLDADLVDVYCEEGLADPRAEGPVWRHGPSCLGNRYVHNLLMDYLGDFLENYNQASRFALSIFHTASEPTQIRAKTMDADLLALLRRLLGAPAEEALEPSGSALWGNSSTLIFLASDQGEGDSPYFHHSKAGQFEHKRPFLYVMAPHAWLMRRPGLRANLRTNAASRLVTSYDIHQTLVHISELDAHDVSSSHKQSPTVQGTSLFHHLPTDRSCDDANIPGNMCVCERNWTVFFMILLLPLSIMIWWVYLWGRSWWANTLQPKRTVYVNSIVFR